MFACHDITRYICTLIRASDVFALRILNKEAHRIIAPLLIGAKINKCHRLKTVYYRVTTIPQLNIYESYPSTVSIAGSYICYGIERILRSSESNSEILRISKYVAPHYKDLYVYVSNNQVKHFIKTSYLHQPYPAFSIIRQRKLYKFLKYLGANRLVVEANVALSHAIIHYGIVTQSLPKGPPTDYNLRILTSEDFLEFIVSFE